MFTHPIATITRLFLISLFLFGAMGRLGAADSKLSPADGQAIGAAAVRWLGLLDEGKYPENFASTSASFRKDLTAEAWAKNHASMQQQFGAVVSRTAGVEMKTLTTQSDDGKETITYTVRIKTKFQKKAGFENVRMEKENGEWKVADYSIEMNI